MLLGAFRFEVHGRVQGVFFRDCTVQKAKALGLVGWVANSRRGTVVGECQGPKFQLQDMKVWLSSEGSPSSRIDCADFKDERDMETLEYQIFERRRSV